MDIKDLKSAWDTYSSQEMDKHRLGKESIHELLKNRTQSLVGRIDRNMKIGMGVLLLFIAYILFDSIFLADYLSKIIVNRVVEYPRWLASIDFFSVILIVTTYLFFVIRYVKIKRGLSIHVQLKDLLMGIRETLKTYQRMFYLAVVVLLINMVVGFVAGFYEGLKIQADAVSGGIINLTTNQILKIVGINLMLIILIVAFLFFVLHWGFNRLYGKYLQSLSETLKELDESEIID